MPIGSICHECHKIIREHTKNGVVINTTFFLTYCSLECKQKHIEKLKLKAKERQKLRGKRDAKRLKKLPVPIGEKCSFCENVASAWHHINPVSNNGTDEKENLILVCYSCHRTLEKLTSERIESYEDFEKHFQWIKNAVRWNPDYEKRRIKMCEFIESNFSDIRPKG
jgi:5-methylcytosine-specific restriction endonuclease McrA